MQRLLVSLALVGLLFACGADPTTSAAPDNKPLEAGQCHAQADCSSSASCARPNTVNLCGGAGCPPNECNTDFDCDGKTPGWLCATYGSVRACEAPCSATKACADHQTCGSKGRCDNKACGVDADCPADFRCAANTCARRFCDNDAGCGGYCVLGDCFPQPGHCEQPAP